MKSKIIQHKNRWIFTFFAVFLLTFCFKFAPYTYACHTPDTGEPCEDYSYGYEYEYQIQYGYEYQYQYQYQGQYGYEYQYQYQGQYGYEYQYQYQYEYQGEGGYGYQYQYEYEYEYEYEYQGQGSYPYQYEYEYEYEYEYQGQGSYPYQYQYEYEYQYQYEYQAQSCGGDNPADHPLVCTNTGVGYEWRQCNACGECYGGGECNPNPTAPPPGESPPTVTSTTISSNTVNTSATPRPQYTITVTATDPNGGNDIGSLYARINFQGENEGMHRGYIGWSTTGGFPNINPKVGTTKVCTTDGEGVVHNGSGDQYINLISCSAPTTIGNTRVVNFVVTFNSNYTAPVNNNTISGYARDWSELEDNPSWRPDGIFDLTSTPPSNVSLSSAPNPSDLGLNVTYTVNATGSCGATGTFQVREGATVVTSGNITGGSGTANNSTLPAGNHSLRAHFTSTVGGCTGIQQSPVRIHEVHGATYIISGKIVNDTNGSNHPASPNISINPDRGTINSNADGTYSIVSLPADNYTVTYSGLPVGYSMVRPRPPSFAVRIGPACNISDPSTGATCSSVGDVVNLNFLISNSSAWMQGYNLDMRFDEGFTDEIPISPLYPPYASAIDSFSNTPGVIFSGDRSSDFGEGDASTTDWVVGEAFPEVFSFPAGDRLRTSYNYLIDNKTRGQVGFTDLETVCSGGLGNCNLPANMTGGVYEANGDLSLQAHSFHPGRDFVILVNGTLTIQGEIKTQPNATVLFSVSEDIVIDRNVGAASNSFPKPEGQVQGFYSADKSFIIEGIDDCGAGIDRMLNIEGAVIVNAAGSGGSFVNHRNLCGDNSTIPSLTITPRLDYILNAPTFIMQQSTISREVAP